MTKRIIRSLSILILLQMCIFICAVSVDALTQSNTNEPNAQDDYVLTEKPVISHSIGDRHNCSEYDATDSLVFFAYSERLACVDAYTYEGDYQFTISLNYRDRGSISIRCHNNLLFIHSRYGNVFIYDGEKLIEQISSEDAKDRGFTISWFQKRSIPIKIVFLKIYRYSDAGNIISTISLPPSVFYQIYVRYIVLISIIVYMIVTYMHRKRILKHL